MKHILLTALCVLAPASAIAESRRALLIGINDYSASRIRATGKAGAPGREWPDLRGPVNDVTALREVLVSAYGFRAEDIVTLTDQQATRAAILQILERHLVDTASKGDVVFYYYAGHGSRVANSRSDESDGHDESVVPADSRRGAPDIRDKELRRLFNRILDRGARLTILLDHCFSGSGARGPDAVRERGIKPDLRDVQDPTDYGPRPERRGALVVSASQDFDTAREAVDEHGQSNGAFSLAWIRALRDAAENEPVSETFARAAARMKRSTPFQQPVLAGLPTVRNAPFLGTRTDRRNGRIVVAVSEVEGNGIVQLHGGWANGLSIGAELRLAGNAASPRLAVTAISGLTRAEGRMIGGRSVPVLIRTGALLEVVSWAAPPVRPLRVWVPTRFATDFPPEGIVAAKRIEEADYILTSRKTGRTISYAWLRPAAPRDAHVKSGLPSRTAWTTSMEALRESLIRLRRIHAWLVLDAPPGSRAPYRLVLRHRDGTEVNGTVLTGEREYTLALRATGVPVKSRRFAYVFAIDSDGAGTLLFPPDGSVENDVTGDAPTLVKVIVGEPYGVDTYILLITDEPLPNPWVLTWEGVRANLSAVRSEWTIERVVYESVSPRRH